MPQLSAAQGAPLLSSHSHASLASDAVSHSHPTGCPYRCRLLLAASLVLDALDLMPGQQVYPYFHSKDPQLNSIRAASAFRVMVPQLCGSDSIMAFCSSESWIAVAAHHGIVSLTFNQLGL